MSEWDELTDQELISLFVIKFEQRYGTVPCYMDTSNREWIVEQLDRITDNVIRAEN